MGMGRACVLRELANTIPKLSPENQLILTPKPGSVLPATKTPLPRRSWEGGKRWGLLHHPLSGFLRAGVTKASASCDVGLSGQGQNRSWRLVEVGPKEEQPASGLRGPAVSSGLRQNKGRGSPGGLGLFPSVLVSACARVYVYT